MAKRDLGPLMEAIVETIKSVQDRLVARIAVLEQRVPVHGRDGRDGAPGERGEKGDRGEKGLDGSDGRPGRDGIDGKDGRDGDPGPRGERGEVGPPGRDGVCTCAPDATRALDLEWQRRYDVLEARHASLEQLLAQQREAHAEQIRLLTEQLSARLIAVEQRALIPGPPGADGKDGRNGVDGKDGEKGADGANGRDGRDGLDGKDGRDGLITLEDVVIVQDETDPKIVRWLRKSDGREIGHAVIPLPIYRGVWDRATAYAWNESATQDGSIWVALQSTTGIKPGTDEAAGIWQLAVKRGAVGPRGEKGLDGRPGRDLTQIDPNTGRKW